MEKEKNKKSILPKAQPALAGEKKKEVNEDLDTNLPADADDLSKHAPALFALKGTEAGFVVPALYFEELSELVIAKTSIPEDGGLVVPENYFEELTAIVEAKTVIPETDGLIVPENYFEELASIIEAKTILPSESGLAVPEKYFEEFGANLESQISLESLVPKVEAEVPEGYFSEMENELHVHIALDNVKQEEGFVVPEGYFENLTSRVLAETVLDKDNINNDEVPTGYFDGLHVKIMSRIEDQVEPKEERGRVIGFAEWKKYTAITAVAAAVALLIVFTWTFMGNSENGNGELLASSPVKNLVPENYVKVIPQPVIDTNSSNIIVTPEGIAIELPKKPKDIKPPLQNNVIEQKNVIMSNEEIIAQSDVMDESMVMDFVAEGGMIQPTDEVLDADMMEYLMNDNATLDVFDPGNKKP